MNPTLMPATGPTVTATSAGGCLEVTPVAGGVRLTSNVSPDQGALFLDSNEWADALQWAKDGKLDGTLQATGTPVTAAQPEKVAA